MEPKILNTKSHMTLLAEQMCEANPNSEIVRCRLNCWDGFRRNAILIIKDNKIIEKLVMCKSCYKQAMIEAEKIEKGGTL